MHSHFSSSPGAALFRRIPLLNLKSRPYRTAGLILLTAFLAFSLFGGSVLVSSLRRGLSSVKARLGADLIAVPVGYDGDMAAILLKGEPGYFYLNRDYIEKISQIEGVKQVSAQFYFTSTSSDCCDLPVQLIGFDPAADFSVQPWIRQNFEGNVKTGALLVGGDILLENETTLTLFGKEYPVAARLEKTGAGLDNAVFASMDTMHDLMTASQEQGFRFLDGIDPEQVISSVLIKTAEGYSTEAAARNIRAALDGVQIIKTQSMISGIADSLGSFSDILRLVIGTILLIALGMLTAAFSITANERKMEFAVLRMLGASRWRLTGLLLRESLLISFCGGALGIGLSALMVFPFSMAISQSLGLPCLSSGLVETFRLLIICLISTLAVGPIAAGMSVWRISRADTSRILREGG